MSSGRGRLLMMGLVLAVVWLAFYLPRQAIGQDVEMESVDLATLHTPPNERFGLNRASFGADLGPGYNLHWALEAGAAWNRWPLYWSFVESGGGFDYSAYDRAVVADLVRGTTLNVVLMGTPSDYATAGIPLLPPPDLRQKMHLGDHRWRAGSEAQEISSTVSTPRNLDQPVYADGTDEFAPGKQINPDNYWARFVNLTVRRYMPNGELHRHGILPEGVGIRHWEIWNEPDVPFYWYARGPGSEIDDYLRLLKVAYLATKSADPEAKIVLGGLSYWNNETWIETVLDAIAADPTSEAHGQYFDVIAWHVYSRSVDLFNRSDWTRSIIASRNLRNKEIWINETNIPVWGDPTPYERHPASHRGTPDEQASFLLQAYALAFLGGADRVFTFMMYDDCWGWGEHYGLVRNPPGDYPIDGCAGDGQPRPGLTAFRVAATFLRDIHNGRIASLGPGGQVDVVTFDTVTGGRVSVAWNKQGEAVTVDLPVRGRAVLVDQHAKTAIVSPDQSGKVSIEFPGATANDAYDWEPPFYIVGGHTYVLYEPPPNNTTVGFANAGFEAWPALAGWDQTGVPPALARLARRGEFAAALGVSPPASGLSAIAQSVRLPANASPTLEFSYALQTSQPATFLDKERSRFEVLVRAPGRPERVVFSDAWAAGWRDVRIPLEGFSSAREVQVTFRVRGDSFPMFAYVDDPSLWSHWLLLPLVPR